MKRSLDPASAKKAQSPKKSNGTWFAIRSFIGRESLLRTVVFALVVFSLLPVFLYGTVSYFRSRAQVHDLVAKQLASIAGAGSEQFEEYIQTRRLALDGLVDDPRLAELLKGIIKPDQVSKSEADSAGTMTKIYLVDQAGGVGEPVFDQVMILDKDGRAIASNDQQWINNTFGVNPPGNHVALRPAVAKGNSSTLLFNPFVSFSNRFALVTVRRFHMAYSPEEYTAVGISSSRLPNVVLKQAAAFFNDASAYYYFKPDDSLVTYKTDILLSETPKNPAIEAAIQPVIRDPKTVQPLSYVSINQKPVLAHVVAIGDLGLYLVLEVPTETLFGQVPLLDTFNIYMLIGSIIILAILAYLGTTRLVNPLVQLSQVARGLAEGNFNLRARVNRRDEVGQLAESMNQMASDLDALYTSLEDKVAQRTKQMRAAGEVAQMATSSSDWEETLEKTVDLINERFGYYHTEIYLVDETGTGLVLKTASGGIGIMRLRSARRLAFGEPGLAAWVAENKTARIVNDLRLEKGIPLDANLPDSRSEAALPIMTGKEILGVLDIFAHQVKAFDPDTLSILQTLATQIASALQNTRLLASAQIDLEETSLLYQLTRQIIVAPDEPSALQGIIEALPQISHVNAFLTLDGMDLHILGLYDSRSKKLERSLNSIDIPANRFIDHLREGRPVFVTDISQPSLYDNILSFFLRRACKTAVILPALKNQELSKVLIIGFHEDERVDQNVLQPFINLAEVLSATMNKFSLLGKLQQQLKEVEILANFSKASSSETDLNHLYGLLHQQIASTFGEDVNFLIALLNHAKNQIDIPCAFESNELISLDSLPLGQGLTSYVIQNKVPLLLTKDTERRAVELGAHIVGKPARSWMGVPLLVGGDLVGALILQDQLRDERFTQSDLDLFTTLAPQIATAIRNAQLMEEMQKALRAYDDERLLINTWLDNTPDIVIVKNAHGHYVRASKSTSDMFNLPGEGILGKSDFDLLDPEAAARATEDELKILQENQASPEVMEKSSRDGEDVWFLTSKIPILGQTGRPTGLLTIRRDITNMKSAEDGARRRANEVLTAAEIAREATSTLNIEELLEKTVTLICERFGFYHASIFLLDPLEQFAVLRESTGEAGKHLKEAEHKLAVGSKSIVGQAAQRKEAMIVADVSKDPMYYPNPLLPNTRAELAIPLKIGDRVLGVLDVQSLQTDVFTVEDISILGILADQLSVAVNNAELFARTQDMLGKHRLLHQITIAASTSSGLVEAMERVVNGLIIAHVTDRACIFLASRGELEVVAIQGYDVNHLPASRLALGQGLIGTSAQESRPILVQDTRHDPRYIDADSNTLSELVLPILFGDEMLGVLNMESNKLAGFDTNDQEIMVALVNNLGALIANWRLVSQIRRQVERQQFLFNAAAKIRQSVDIQTIMQTSVNEIGRALGVQGARITLAQTDNDFKESQPPRKGSGNGSSNNGWHPEGEVKG